MNIRIALILLCSTLLLSGCGYNSIQKNEEAVFAAWGDVEATYQRRADLIPNLVETVKAYAAHEKENTDRNHQRPRQSRAGSVIGRQIGRCRHAAEIPAGTGRVVRCPVAFTGRRRTLSNLKASQNFRDLQNQLEGTENRINVARQRYNKAVQTFNSSIRTFPNNLTNQLSAQP